MMQQKPAAAIERDFSVAQGQGHALDCAAGACTIEAKAQRFFAGRDPQRLKRKRRRHPAAAERDKRHAPYDFVLAGDDAETAQPRSSSLEFGEIQHAPGELRNIALRVAADDGERRLGSDRSGRRLRDEPEAKGYAALRDCLSEDAVSLSGNVTPSAFRRSRALAGSFSIAAAGEVRSGSAK